MITRLGLSRTSSVFGLKVTPRIAMVMPRTEPPQAWTIRRTMLRLRLSLTETTLSTMRSETLASSAIRSSAAVSLGKHEPPKPGPGCRNLLPIRRSRPRPLATSWTSAPMRSHRSAISLMKVTLVARKLLVAYLISSAVSSEVNTIGVWLRFSGRYRRSSTWRACSVSTPTTTRSGRMKSSIAEPSRRNSGFEATSIARSGRSLANSACSLRPVPTGTVDLVTTTVASTRPRAISSAAANR